MARKKKFSPREKREILEEIKLLWERSEKITYRQLEEIQKQKWKQVIYKAGTLRNYAHKEGWNRNKGIALEEKREEKKQEIIQGASPELLEKVDELEEHSLIMKGLDDKYRPEFDKAWKRLGQAINEEDTKGLKFADETFKAISRARKIDLELMGSLDIADQRKIELEILKMELLTLEKTNKVIGGGRG